MLNRHRTRQVRRWHGHKIDLTGTANNAPISLNPRARLGSAHPVRNQGGDRSATPRDRLAPGLVALATLPRRHNIRVVGEMALSNAPAKEQTAGCG
jgi:hypothetical protein